MLVAAQVKSIISLLHQKLNWIFDLAIGNNLGLFYSINSKEKSCFADVILEQHLVCDNLKTRHFWKLKNLKKNRSLELPVLLFTVEESPFEAPLVHFTQHHCCGQPPLEAEPSGGGFGWEAVVKDCGQGDLP